MSDHTDPAPTEAERAIVAAAQNGDASAHAAIYSRYSQRLYTLIYRLIPRRAHAEDLLQEVFVEVLRNIGSYSANGSFGGWLRSIAVNKALMHLRSPWHRSVLWLDESPDPIFDPHSTFDAVCAAQRDLESALGHLPPLSRAVVWLHDVEGYTHTEIACALGKTQSFSKSQLARAHERLRELLAPHEASPCPPATQSLPINS